MKTKTFKSEGYIKPMNDAAKLHALSVLGEEQFKKNPDAVKSIKADFVAGAKAFFNYKFSC